MLQARLEDMDKIYISYKILKKIFKNYFKGNLFTVYLVSLIELIKPKVVITNIDNSLKFTDAARILEKEAYFFAIQNAARYDLLGFDYLYSSKQVKYNFNEKFYIPNLFSFGDHEKDLYKKLNVTAKNIYPIGDLRWANFMHYIKNEKDFDEKYNCDICLLTEHTSPGLVHHAIAGFDVATQKRLSNPKLNENITIEKGLAQHIKYTIKFCIKNNMKLLMPLKRDKKVSLEAHQIEIDFFKRHLEKEEFDYFQKHRLDRETNKFSTYRAVLNSKITIGIRSTLLRNKLSVAGKILACNFTKNHVYDFPIKGLCVIKDCSYEEFEQRLLEIYSLSNENFLSKISHAPDYVMKFNKNYSTIDLIRDKLSQLGINQN